MKYYGLQIFLFLCLTIFSLRVYSANQKEHFDRDSIALILKQVYARDQAPRLIIDSLMKKGITDGNLFLPTVMQQRSGDSINLKEVLPIVDAISKYAIYDLEAKAYETCWLVIQHADNNIKVKYTSFVEQLAKRKLIPLSSYMAFIDRLNIDKYKAQIYGYQFKRFANGALMQYPVLKGWKRKWKDLGLKCKKNILPSEYVINYPIVYINRNQYALIGFIYKGKSDWGIEKLMPIKDAAILVSGKVVTTANANGYFFVILNKKMLPKTINIRIDGHLFKYSIQNMETRDFSILGGYYSDGKLDIIDM
jgi:hypothetical protein